MSWPKQVRVIEESAPAKVNLWLQVGRRWADGLHSVRSLAVAVTLADRIEVWYKPDCARSVSTGARLVPTRDPSSVIRDRLRLRIVGATEHEMEDNLCLRAARWWMERFGQPPGQLEIVLHKEIPIAVGLGGGSSDAAAVLRALGRMVGQPDPTIVPKGVVELGSDVPFCMAGRPAVVEGRGERISFRRVSVSALCLVWPGWSWSSADAYAALDSMRSGGDVAGHFGSEPRLGWNDFWPLAKHRWPNLAQLRRNLDDLGASATGISGKGPLLFGVFETLKQAERAAALLDEQGLWVRAVEVIPGRGAAADLGEKEGSKP